MSTATKPVHRPPVSEDVPYEFTADAFFRMVEAGEFPDEVRVYLEEGSIYEKMAKTNAHGMAGSIFSEGLRSRLPPGWFILGEGQFKLDEMNSPLPDIAIIRGSARAYFAQNRHPEARDLGLVVEIAVTSLAKDLGPNSERYARGLIPQYWVADVPGRRILAHSRPRVVEGHGAYEVVQIRQPGDHLPLVLDGQEIARFSYEDLMP